MNKPCFYISDYFEKNRTEYYDSLTRVRENNDMISWIKFFLKGVIITAQIAKKKFQKVVITVKNYEEKVSKTNLSFPTVNNILKRLENIGILEELTNYKRNKIYVLMEYLSIFIEGIE